MAYGNRSSLPRAPVSDSYCLTMVIRTCHRIPLLSHLTVIIHGMTISSSLDSRISLLASRQASAFSRQQALAVGATDPMIARRLRSGRWTRPHPGVYVLTGSPPSWLRDVWCAL